MKMKQKLIMTLLALACCATLAAQPTGNGYPYTQVPFTSVKMTAGSFWGDRLKAATDVTIPLAFSKCESEDRYSNFVKAANPDEAYDVGKFMGFPFDDTDVYKTIEGASYSLQTYPNKVLEAYIDSVLTLVAAAQLSDGYLYTARTINPEKPHPWSGPSRWSEVENGSHELYDLGHMVDAACAHYQATGSTKFLDIAERYADCVVREIGPRAGQTTVVPGHQIAEMALARLYVLTGKKKYLDEAKYMLDYRGRTHIRNAYSQSYIPVVEQREAVGHAVRAGYMYAGMADIAALTGDSSYIKAIDAIWENIVSKKYYLTGGVGARHNNEGFGENYELPNMSAYNETCAAIAQCYLNLRLFLLHGDSKYIDCLERTLYNGVISGMSMDGGKFFYPNPLSSDGAYKFNSDGTTTRQPWFGCACCPSNLCRFIPSVPGYLYAVKDNSIYVNLFADNIATMQVNSKEVTLQQTTEYPWSGDISIRVVKSKAKDITLKVRIPGWARSEVVPSDLYAFSDSMKTSWSVTLNGKTIDASCPEKGYVSISGARKGDVVRIHLDMIPRMVIADSRVADDKGRVAVERGPLVYCAESPDNQGFDVLHTVLDSKAVFKTMPGYKITNTEGNGKQFSVTALTTSVQALSTDSNGILSSRPVTLTMIPYYAWNHRGAARMQVWMPAGLGVLEK